MMVTSFAEVDTDAKAVQEDGGGKAKETGLGRKVLPRQQFLRQLPRQRFWLIFREDDEYSPSEWAIPYHAIMNCLRCLSLIFAPF